jgi:hypothetical protein
MVNVGLKARQMLPPGLDFFAASTRPQKAEITENEINSMP